ncbi:MAG TPA: ABC transporter permease [Blastocatellia bacterium]|nr:ABC transporter permease [Blastocatellia bacterium]
MQTLLQDLRYGARMLMKNPGLTSIAALTLALGIGANTAMFSLIDAVLLKSLPVRQPDELVSLSGEYSFHGLRVMREYDQVSTGLAAFTDVRLGVSIAGQGEPTVLGHLVSGNYFSVLGVHPIIGRLLVDDDDRAPGAHPVAVISHGYWNRRFGADHDIVGKTISLAGMPFTIIGVTPPEFFGAEVGRSPDVFAPVMMAPQFIDAPPGSSSILEADNYRIFTLFGRLKPGVTGTQAAAGLEAPFRQVRDELAKAFSGGKPWVAEQISRETLAVTSFSGGLSQLRRQFSKSLLILMTVVVLVLLIACANLANLLLARASGRKKEIAVRLCLGAGRWRLIRQLLTESLLLATMGGILGLLFASWGRQLLLALMSTGSTPISLDVRTDYRVLGFTGAVSILTAILFGLMPAFRATRVDLSPALKDNARGLGGGIFRNHLGKALVVSQVALSVILIAGAGLFVRTLYNLNHQRTGLKHENVLAVRVEPKGSDNKHANSARLSQIYLALIERVEALPGVSSATLSNPSPFSRGSFDAAFRPGQLRVDGLPAADQNPVQIAQVYPRYFATLGISLLSGRDIQLSDCSADAPKVVVINKTLARRVFQNADPLGRRLGRAGEEFEVVGVVDDVKFGSLREEFASVIYYPFPNGPTGRGQMTLQARTTGDPSALAPAIRAEVRRIDESMAVFDVRPLSAFIAATIVQERLLTMLLSFFGLLAMLLAAIGLYGVIAYSVSQRTQEIGVRISLGARSRDVLRLVIGQGMKLVLIGVIMGLAAAFGLTRLLKTLLFGVSATDPLTFVVIALLLTLVALLACYLPARRATKVDPMIALRCE